MKNEIQFRVRTYAVRVGLKRHTLGRQVFFHIGRERVELAGIEETQPLWDIFFLYRVCICSARG